MIRAHEAVKLSLEREVPFWATEEMGLEAGKREWVYGWVERGLLRQPGILAGGRYVAPGRMRMRTPTTAAIALAVELLAQVDEALETLPERVRPHPERRGAWLC